MTGRFPRGKRGISLAYVIVAVMVLLVLSGMLAAAARRNLNLTSVSTQSRQAYLTVKSAVAFAQGEALRREQAGDLSNFSVAPDGGLFKAVNPAGRPDGKTTYALCTVGDGGLVTVSGKVSYGESGRYRSLGCSFRLKEPEEASGIGAINSFTALGGYYYTTNDNGQFMNGGSGGITFKWDGRSAYPVVLKDHISVSGSSNSLEAPSIFCLGGLNGGTAMNFLSADTRLVLKTKFLYLSGSVQGYNLPRENKRSQFWISPKSSTQDSTNDIYIWFDQATVSLDTGMRKTLDGLYRFPDKSGGMDLFDASVYDSAEKVAEGEEAYDRYFGSVSFFRGNADQVVSGENRLMGADWSRDGKLSTTPSSQSGNDVFFYVNSSAYATGGFRGNVSVSYVARSVILQYIGNANAPFTVPNVTFQVDSLWMNGQSQDGPPDDSGDSLVIRQGTVGSKFVLKSSGGESPVTLYLPHGMDVRNVSGNTLYTLDAGTYQVKSGTDLFRLSPQSAEDSVTKVSDEIGGGSGGEDVTASDLRYTDA